jgi:parallel beta-helix repeat protein
VIASYPSHASTIIVDKNSNNNSIQAAIDRAEAADTIIVYSGTYYENIIINKPLSIIGMDNGGGKPVIDAKHRDNVIKITADGARVEGFSITGSKDFHAGILVMSGNNVIEGNNIYNNFNGVYSENSKNSTYSDNIVYNNKYDGISIYRANGNVIKGNNVHDNYKGIYLNYSTNSEVSGNDVQKNDKYGIELNHSDSNLVTKNEVSQNKEGGIMVVFSSDNNLLSYNTINENALDSKEGQSWNAITLYLSNGNTVSDNSMSDNGGIVVRSDGTYRLGDAVMAMDTKDSVIKNNKMYDNHYAVWIYRSTGATVTGNEADKHYYCIVVEKSQDSLISDNILKNGGRNAKIDYSSNIVFKNNELTDGIYAMSVTNSNNNIIDNNILKNSKHDGLLITSSNNNVFSNNTIVNNYAALYVESSNNNRFFLNDFDENDHNIRISGSTNHWSSSSPVTYTYKGKKFTGYLGNKWGKNTGADADNNGVIDSPVNINSNNIDRYPLLITHENYPIGNTIKPTAIPSVPTVSPTNTPPGDNDIFSMIIRFITHLFGFDLVRCFSMYTFIDISPMGFPEGDLPDIQWGLNYV